MPFTRWAGEDDVRAAVPRLEAKRAELAELAERDGGGAGVAERAENIQRGITNIDHDLAEARERIARYERIRELAKRPGNREAGAVFIVPE